MPEGRAHHRVRREWAKEDLKFLMPGESFYLNGDNKNAYGRVKV
jgi:hypothetical protein